MLFRYWNPSEFSDFVGPCFPSERCLGGQFAECAVGYEGRYCSQCQVGFFLSFKLCEPCGENTTTILLYTACGLFVGLFTLCIFFMPNDVMNHIFGTITMLQTFRGLAVLGSTKVPPVVKQFYSTLGLFTLDFGTVDSCWLFKESGALLMHVRNAIWLQSSISLGVTRRRVTLSRC